MKNKGKVIKLNPKTNPVVDKLIMVDGVLEGIIFDMTDPNETEGVYECESPYIKVNFNITKKQEGVYLGNQTSIITHHEVTNPKLLRLQLLGALAILPLKHGAQ